MTRRMIATSVLALALKTAPIGAATFDPADFAGSDQCGVWAVRRQ